MASVQALIFDIDGTLINSPALIFAAKAHLADKFDLPPRTEAEIRVQIGKPLLEMYEGLWPDADGPALLKENNEYVRKNYHKASTFEGLHDLLERFRQQGIVMVAVTGGGASVADVLKRHKIHQYFAALVHSEMVQKHKPDPEGVHMALVAAGIKPGAAVMVGDMHYDIGAGKNAGVLATVGVTHGFGSREQLEEAGADYIIDSLSQLPDVIDTIEHR